VPQLLSEPEFWDKILDAVATDAASRAVAGNAAMAAAAAGAAATANAKRNLSVDGDGGDDEDFGASAPTASVGAVASTAAIRVTPDFRGGLKKLRGLVLACEVGLATYHLGFKFLYFFRRH
jgi:hypothetical protein